MKFGGVRQCGVSPKNFAILCVLSIQRKNNHLSNKQQSEATLSQLYLQTTPNAVLLLDEQGMILAHNTAAQNRYGSTAADLTGQCFYDRLPLAQSTASADQIAAVLTAGQPVVFESEWSGRWDEITLRPVRNDAGVVTQIMLVAHDKTDYKQIGEALAQDTALWEQAERIANMGRWQWNFETDRFHGSTQYYCLTGRDVADYPDGISSEELIAVTYPADLDYLRQAWESGKTPGVRPSQYRIMRLDGAVRTIRTEGREIFDGQGSLIGRSGVTQDITDYVQMAEELKQHRDHLEELVKQRTAELDAAYERLQELDRMKDEFIASVSHELRTPVTNLKLHAHLLARRPENSARYLQVLHQEADRLQEIIESILYVTRMMAELAAMVFMPVDLNELLTRFLANDRPLLLQQGLTLRHEMAQSPMVMANERLLARALQAALTNARTYTPAGGQILVHTGVEQQADQQWAVIQIQDSGPGVPPGELSLLFERFYRGQSALEAGIPGAGLGLFIAQEIVRYHGGSIQLATGASPDLPGLHCTIRLPIA